MFNKLVKARNSKKGFTLIEVMVVVAIIAILAAVAIPAYLSYRDDAKREVAKSSFSAVMESYNGYVTINGEGTTIDAQTTIGDIVTFLSGKGANVTTDHLELTKPFIGAAKEADSGYYIIDGSGTDFDWLTYYKA